MKFIADFHIHSHYSIATSKNLIPEYLDLWAGLKGIKVVGTGDFTHPGWVKELKEKLEPAEPGLFRLKDKYKQNTDFQTLTSSDNEARFLLTSEISNIYKKDGKVRKVHNLIFAPDFKTVEKIQQKLIKIGGNITSDGRPILGLDSRDLLEIVISCSEKSFFVPAHIWTPWFSALGSKSGFDSIEECYGDLSEHIFAVETGLSTDPPMHWICSFLDKYRLLSNSDAHSPEKLGRNANLFNTEISYNAIIDAVKTGKPEHFLGTIDLFPQEGKYHYDGHRKCNMCWSPLETLKHNEICPVCGKKITVGVMNRIAQLADRYDPLQREKRLPFHSIIPLKEIISEILEVGPGSQRVAHAYNTLLQKAGTELDLLLNLPVKEVERASNSLLAEAIRRMRNRQVYVKEGFDGEFGKVKVFQEGEKESFGSQDLLFKHMIQVKPLRPRKLINFDLKEYARLRKTLNQQSSEKAESKPETWGLNREQQKAAEHFSGPALIIAGPGTGKTRTLTYRIANLVQHKNIDSEHVLAVTFTNKAANEMKERLYSLLDKEAAKLQVCTFHALGYSILKEQHAKIGRDKQFSILDEDDKKLILQKIGCKKKQVGKVSEAITNAKQNLKSVEEIEDKDLSGIFLKYKTILHEQNSFDLDDLIYCSVRLFMNFPEVLSQYREKYQWCMVDEYQDINFAQYQMIRSLMPEYNSNLCVIGDPNQAIYGFRGADVRFIRRFLEDYPGAAAYRLKKTYRCSDYILKASSEVIQSKEFVQGLQKGVKIKIVENSSEKSEAEFVARTIENMIGGLRFFSIDSKIADGIEDSEIKSLSDFVVLCRINRQIKDLEKAFNDHSIPYQTIGDTPFFREEPVKSIIDMLKLVINPENSLLKDKLTEKKIISYKELEKLNDLNMNTSVRTILVAIINTYFSKKKLENETQFKNLLDLADDFGNDAEKFLQFAVLGTGVDTYKPNMENVTLMTLHSAKGLEFKCVFIVGCEDGLLPYSLFKNQKSDPEEERRLLYVGMTRAERFLFLSHTKKRFILGREYHLKRSPFLSNIEKGLIELSKTEHKKKENKDDLQMSLFFHNLQ
ncbi:UvrD-helicase domain-containing protein [bacterium]|nr:UvrD-helicase domain-containing protein [bacterium]